MKYTLVDGEKMNKLHPNTYEIPSKYDVGQLQEGNYVKLCFEEEGGMGERMWVIIKKINGRKFEGELNNEPLGLQSIKLGDKVFFEKSNIIAIM